MRFSDSNSHRTGYKDNIENHPVQEQKVVIFEQSSEANCIKKFENMKAFRTDLKNLVISEYNCTVESVPELLDDFNRRYSGYNRY
jgi:putative DNA primase/helicase